MKFIKGVMIGTMISAGVMMMYSDTIGMKGTRKKAMKKGKQIAKKMGIL